MKSWWQILIAAVASLALWWQERFGQKNKAKKEAYEKVETEIDTNGDVGDVQSGIDDLLNGL